MDFVPFDTVGLTASQFNDFHQTYNVLKEKFNIQPTGNINFNLDDFESFKFYTDVRIRGSFVIKRAKNDCYILFVEVRYKTMGDKTSHVYHQDYQTWAISYLKQDFGRILIRRETLADKIVELVHPVEIDFAEDKAFSNTFYVLANDHQKAVAGMNRDFRNAVMDTRSDDFVIEINEYSLIIGNRHTLSPEKTVHLAEFIERVANLC
ncbi:hypothetical protein [Mucilaginibacter sp.]